MKKYKKRKRSGENVVNVFVFYVHLSQFSKKGTAIVI